MMKPPPLDPRDEELLHRLRSRIGTNPFLDGAPGRLSNLSNDVRLAVENRAHRRTRLRWITGGLAATATVSTAVWMLIMFSAPQDVALNASMNTEVQINQEITTAEAESISNELDTLISDSSIDLLATAAETDLLVLTTNDLHYLLEE